MKEFGWLHRLDLRFSTYMQMSEESQQSDIKRHLAVIFGHSGDSWIWIIGLSMLWLYGEGSVNAAARTMIISILITAALTFIIKC